MQGVSVNVFVKTGKKLSTLATVHHHELQGKRNDKYASLTQGSLKACWQSDARPAFLNTFFVPKNFESRRVYKHGFFSQRVIYNQFQRHQNTPRSFVIDIDEETLKERIKHFDDTLTTQEATSKFNLKDNRDWSSITEAMDGTFADNLLKQITY